MVQQLQTAALTLIVLFCCIGSVSVLLRLFSRWLTKTFGWDDGLIVFAWILAVTETYTVYTCMWTSLNGNIPTAVLTSHHRYSFDLGYHIYDIPPLSVEQTILGQKYNLANQVLYNPILSLIKLSVLIFLYRLRDRRRPIRWNLHALFVFETLFMIAATLVDLFQCAPLRYVYEYRAMDLAAQQAAGADENGMKDGVLVKGGHCIQQAHFFFGVNGIAIFTDLWILAIPVIMLWDLQMPRRQKFAAFGILGAGGIVVVVGVIRLVIYIQRFSPNNHDQPYGVGYTTSSLVVHIAFLAACAPALKAIFTRYVPHLFSGGSHRTNYDATGRTHTGITVNTSIQVTHTAHELNDITRKKANESEEEIISHHNSTTFSSVHSHGKTSVPQQPQDFVH